MKILVDENIPLTTVDELKRRGGDVLSLHSSEYKGLSDTELWAIAQREKRLLITTDKGFAQYRGAHHYGVLIIRLRQPNRRVIHERVLQAINHFSEVDWLGMAVTMRDKTMTITTMKKS